MKFFLFYKPDGVLTQFRPVEGKKTLSDFGPFPKDVHPVGRLDEDTEGLLILTNDGVVHQRLIDPGYEHPRTYLAEVERVPPPEALTQLSKGVEVEGSTTRPADVRLLDAPPGMPERNTPIRFRKNVPTAWIEITLREGRNRQVRKMTAAVGHPTLRLVRISAGPLDLAGLRPGEMRPLTPEEVSELRTSVDLTGRGRSTAGFGAPGVKKPGKSPKPWIAQGRGGPVAPWSRRGAGGTRNTRGRG